MAARAGSKPSLCGPLQGVTLVTDNSAATTQFLTQAMRMQLVADDGPATTEARWRRRLWGIAEGLSWRELTFRGTDTAQGITVRVLVMAGGEIIRPGMDSRLTGGLSIGYPVASLPVTLGRVTALGVENTAGIVPLTITRPDGTSYVSGEILFRGPEQIYMLAVGRPADMIPVGPIDPTTGIGGPAYSAMVVPDALREIEFYQQVLGWEARQNIVLTTSGPAGGLGLDAGTQFRFVQLFAPGASSAYVVLLDMMATKRDNPVVPRIPNRGLVLWTFGTHVFDEVEHRVRRYAAAGSGSGSAQVAGVTGERTLTVLSPAGLMIEIVEQPTKDRAT